MVHTEEHRRMHFGFGAPKLTQSLPENLGKEDKSYTGEIFAVGKTLR